MAVRRGSIKESRRCSCTVSLNGMVTRGQMITHKLEMKDASGAEIEIVTKYETCLTRLQILVPDSCSIAKKG